MPPWTLPDNKTRSGIETRSSKGGSASTYNQIRFEDKMGSEEVNVQAQKDMNTLIKNNETRVVKGTQTLTVTGDQSTEITQGNQSNLVDMGNQTNELKMGNQTTTLDMGNITTKCSLGSITMQAMQSITLQVGPNSIVIDVTGVTINGIMVSVQASAVCQIQGTLTTIN
jgi:type VI secretion system secreted protein VgrG